MIPKTEIPTFNITVPSTGKQVAFRPFLVKEQKVLLTALETGTEEDIVASIENIVTTCSFGKVDGKKSPAFDLEYIFVQLRAKSVNEIANFVMECNCGNEVKHDCELTSLKIEMPNKDNKILFENGDGVAVRYPTYEEQAFLEANLTEENIQNQFINCVEAVFTADGEYYTKEDNGVEAIAAYIDELLPRDFAKIEEYFEIIPTLKYHLKEECSACKNVIEFDIEGLGGFFG